MDWADSAACRGKPSEWFFPEAQGTYQQGRAVCDCCPVSTTCLVECLRREARSGDRWGLWGGLTPAERDFLVVRGRFERRIA